MRCLPFAAMLLASAASASAQGVLSSDEALVAYCHGAWSAQSLAIEQLIEGACGPAGTAGECDKVKKELAVRRARVQRNYEKLNDALYQRGLIGEGGWVGQRGAEAGSLARAASRQGASEVLACLRLNLPTMPKSQAPTSDDSCERIWRRCGPDLTG
jgi:hypothetical protein